jgi:hypothetical protein
MNKINFQLLSLLADMFKIGFRVGQTTKHFRSDKDLGEEGHVHGKALLQEYYKLRVYKDADEFANELLTMHNKAYRDQKPHLEVV